MDASLVLSTIAWVAVRSSTSVLAAVGSAFGVHAHDVLLKVGLGHKTFWAQLTMILLLLMVLGYVQSEYPTVLEHFHTKLANECFVTVHCTHVHLQVESSLEDLVTFITSDLFVLVKLHVLLQVARVCKAFSTELTENSFVLLWGLTFWGFHPMSLGPMFLLGIIGLTGIVAVRLLTMHLVPGFLVLPAFLLGFKEVCHGTKLAAEFRFSFDPLLLRSYVVLLSHVSRPGLSVHRKMVTVRLEAGVGRGVDTVGGSEVFQKHIFCRGLNRAQDTLQGLDHMFQAGFEVALDVVVVRMAELKVAELAVGQTSNVLLFFDFRLLMFNFHVPRQVVRIRKCCIADVTLHLLQQVRLADLLVTF